QTVRKRHRRLRYLLRQLRHFFCLLREGAARVASPSGTNLDKLGRRLDGCEVTRKVEGRYGIFLRHVEHSYIAFPRLVDGGQCVLLNSACSLRGRGGHLIESPLGLASALIGEHVGPMDIVLELRLADNTLLDRKPLRLEWVAAGPKQSTGSPIRQLDPREIADLIKRGEGFISAGDLASARLVLQRAAEAGDPQAALMRRGPMIRSY